MEARADNACAVIQRVASLNEMPAKCATAPVDMVPAARMSEKRDRAGERLWSKVAIKTPAD